MKKILFVLKKRMSYGGGAYNGYDGYGISFGLINSARFVAKELSKIPGIETKVVEVQDNNCIDREVFQYKPTHVIIEALWVVPEKFPVLIKLHPKVHWIVRLHSKPAFLANEGNAMGWIGEYIKIGKANNDKLSVSVNNKEFACFLSEIYKTNVLYTPNIYPDVFRHNTRKPVGEHIDIGAFGALRPMKNFLTQALAAISFSQSVGKKLRFHINSDRIEQKGESVLKNLQALFKDMPNAELVEHTWRNHQDFLELVGKMDLGTQVSLSETFNIVSADFISMGIPILVCKEVEFAPALYIADPSSISSIEKGYARLLALDNPLLTYWAKLSLVRANEKAVLDWREVLRS